MSDKIYVIGAGVVGISCAIALQRDGHNVVLIDKEGPAAGASFGNAGAIVNGSCIPTATPGIALSALKMMLTNGPLSISPASLPRLLPWLMRFIVQSSQQNYLTNAAHLVNLTKDASHSWQTLLQGTDCHHLVKDVGWLRVFESTATFNASLVTRNLMTELNTPFETLNFDEIYQLEPNLNKIFKHGFYQSDCQFVINPGLLLQQLTQHFTDNGGRFEIQEVTNIYMDDQQPVIKTTTDEIKPAKLVVTAGIHSTELTKGLKYSAPLVAERGYHIMLPATSSISRPIVNADQSFVLCPMQTGLRLTSQVELASTNTKANYKKIRSLVPKVKHMLPDAQLEEQSVWMGARPSLPDSLPIISCAEHNNVYYAFGHQHLGLTLGPKTGELIADLIAKRPSSIDLSPYRADRF